MKNKVTRLQTPFTALVAYFDIVFYLNMGKRAISFIGTICLQLVFVFI